MIFHIYPLRKLRKCFQNLLVQAAYYWPKKDDKEGLKYYIFSKRDLVKYELLSLLYY